MMGADSEDVLAGKLPIGVCELGLGVSSHDDALDSERVHTTNFRALPNDTNDNQKDFKRVQHIGDEQTSVQIIFKLLSRKSKKKLEELLHQWSEWHAQECSQSEGSDEDLESGEETYFPAINVAADKSCTISFYMDSQVKKKRRTTDAQFNKGAIPTYDRDFAFALMSDDGLTNKESVLDIMNASRCFNCDAYDHSLKECPKPFNKVVVNNARKLHQLKSKRPAGPRVLTRYYQDTPGGKFDGLKPGCLDPDTRKLLGLGEYDPPPWLNRMREMGYPPGYLDLLDEDQPSGIIIYSNENGDGDAKEHGESVNANSTDPKRNMSVDFPGINAPIPEKADQSRWVASNSRQTGFNSCSDMSLLNYKIESSPEFYLRNRSHNPSLWPGSRQFMSDSAHNSQNYAPGFPLFSSYANNYLDQINQQSSHYSPYAYQNPWSLFHG